MLKRKRNSIDPGDVEVNVILPCSLEAFRKVSVDIVDGKWGARLTRALRHITNVLEVNPMQDRAEAIDFEYTNLVQDGLSQLRAKMLYTEIVPLIVWDGDEGDSGGTASMAQHWLDHGVTPNIIDISKIRRKDAIEVSMRKEQPVAKHSSKTRRRALPVESSRQICAMLFGDVVGFTNLREEQIGLFVKHFMGIVANTASKYTSAILSRNTWGDAIHMIFSSVESAGLYALELCEQIAMTDWAAVCLPPDINLRLGLHAGPVERYNDPVLQTLVYNSRHVSRAARIEQITPPGHVYSSQEFAALATSMGVRSFAVDYAGNIDLPKHFGDYPLYHVRRTKFQAGDK
jgi:class 3 adenylate cyclase